MITLEEQVPNPNYRYIQSAAKFRKKYTWYAVRVKGDEYGRLNNGKDDNYSFMHEWVLENTTGYWTIIHKAWPDYIFEFTDPNDAALFKLTFGGQ